MPRGGHVGHDDLVLGAAIGVSGLQQREQMVEDSEFVE